MTKPKQRVQLQFHADAQEMIALAVEWARQQSFTLVAEQYFPDYRAVAIPKLTPAHVNAALERVDRLALCAHKPDLTASTTQEFAARNNDCLYLSVNHQIENSLRETALGGTTNDPQLLKVWKSLVRKMKSQMHKGAIVRSTHSGAIQTLAAHLHSPRVHTLAAQGISMLAATGSNEYIFYDCEALDSSSYA